MNDYDQKIKCKVCGKEISGKYRFKQHERACIEPKFCLFCSKQISYYKKFCNNSCAAFYNNKNCEKLIFSTRGGKSSTSYKPKNPDTYIPPIKINQEVLSCLNCGKLKKGRKYCCLKCQNEHEYKDKVSRWLSGELSGTGNGGPEYYIKRYLMEQKSSCSKCGWNEINPYTKNYPLHLHHIDGIWNHNRPENLILLCPNCHSLTKNFGSRNKGNGKPWMREYYKTYSKISTSYKEYENNLKEI